MAKSEAQKLVKLDGRTGEGGGQLVRIAVSLAALTGTPLQITNVRGNRIGKRNGGLKAQHVTAIKWLAKASSAETDGCFVGSKTVEFRPNSSPADIVDRNIKIDADSAASLLLVLQAILPILLFAGDATGTPITLSIRGGSNASYSLSYEYLDQVLLPTLERFDIRVERQLKTRGWSQGPLKLGCADFKIYPIPLGQSLKAPDWPTERGTLQSIDVSTIVPEHLQQPLEAALRLGIERLFPGVQLNFILTEASTQIYTILVAHTSEGLRFGRDWLYDRKTKGRSSEDITAEIADRVIGELDVELKKGGQVDEYLQDQLIIFQALADGRSTILGHGRPIDSRGRQERTEEPFGDGSKHAATARWVASQMLPQAKWFDRGQTCEGVGWKVAPSTPMSLPEA